MKRSLFFLFVLLTLPLTAFAGRVTREQALKTARDFMSDKTFNTAIGYCCARGVFRSSNAEPFYVFNATDGGYVIVSGDDRTREILGYSQTGTLHMDSLPANLQWWLDEYARQIDALGTSTVAVKSLKLSGKSAIPPLIHTTWDQSAPYNYMCPDGNGKDYDETGYDADKRCLTGCVATAMAQVMKYWQWPESCPALEAYTTDRIEAYSTDSFYVKRLPSTTFNWNLMKDHYDYKETGDAADAVAKLMRYCGQAVKMNYGTSASPGYTYRLKEVFTKTFNYSSRITNIYRDSYTLIGWEIAIYNELAEGRPVLYSGDDGEDGHEFVVDGYSSDGLFHINWGWGGLGDDYFVLSVADPEQSGGIVYRYNQDALIRVKPSHDYEIKRPYAVLSDDSLTVTFYYDNLMISRNGMAIGLYNGRNQTYTSATTAIFDDSFADYHPYFMDNWFFRCEKLKEIKSISNLSTDSVTDMSSMFYGCSSLTSLDLSGLNAENVTDMSRMFSGCSSLTSLNLSGFKTKNVINMYQMFWNCSSLTSLDLSGFKTDSVTSMSQMFYGCSSLTSLDLSGFKTNNVKDMLQMFYFCSNLMSLDLSSFKTEKVSKMSRMFFQCSSLTNLDLSGFKTDSITDMSSLFSYCSSLTSLDLSSFKTDSVTNMSYMFYRCSNLATIYAGEGWSTDKVGDSEDMFNRCYKLTGGEGTKYNSLYTDQTYARIDGGVESPGYFTDIARTAIHVVKTDSVSATGNIYDVKGLKREDYIKGLNIIRMSDGTVKRLLLK